MNQTACTAEEHLSKLNELAQGKYILWGAHCGLYPGKTRANLIKKGIDYIEINSSHPYYVEVIQPKIGYFVVPVLQTPAGDLIQDTTDIMLFLEERHPEPSLIPENKVLRALAWLHEKRICHGCAPAPAAREGRRGAAQQADRHGRRNLLLVSSRPLESQPQPGTTTLRKKDKFGGDCTIIFGH